MKKIAIIFSLTLVTGYWLLVTSLPVFAAEPYNWKIPCDNIGGSWDGSKCSISNPLGADVSAQKAVGIVIRGLLGVVGIVALVFFIYGGFLWMTASGDEKKYKAGWEIMTWTALGMVLIFASSAIVSFLLKVVGVE